MKISLFRDGYTNLHSNEVIEDWDEFVDLVTVPKVGPKNGAYFVRGFCDGPREDASMAGLDLIIIDGDQLVDNGGSCCPPEPVHDAMQAANITHVMYSSYSNDVVNNRFKWRLVVPCPDLLDEDTLRQGIEEILTLLHKRGLMVLNVSENKTLSQPWFTPRCPAHACEDFYFAYHDGDPWRLRGDAVADTVKAGQVSESTKDAGHFSWEYVIGQFAAGTLHQGIKSVCGWLIYTSDWSDSQIKQYLISHIRAICPDQEKVKRACETKEIDQLIKYCRGKQGVIEHQANWKDHLTTAAELQGKEFPPIKWAVDGIIPEGLTVLAGDPKAGKSLMAVDICSAIASGARAFGNRQCVEGSCVYVSLEDPERRVRARIEQQCNRWPDKFKLLTGGVSQLGPEFYRLLDEMILLWPDMRSIVIDTMQFIIPPKPSGVPDYDHYYKLLDPLHRWALNNHVAIILITHKTKSRGVEGDNPFSGIIGSVAIQGTADAMLMLCKNHAKDGKNDPEIPDGFLAVQGREVGSERFALEFDAEALVWCIKGEAKAKDLTNNENWANILMVLQEKELTPAEISAGTKINTSTCGSCLFRMKAKKLLYNSGGKYGITGRDYSPEAVSKW